LAAGEGMKVLYTGYRHGWTHGDAMCCDAM